MNEEEKITLKRIAKQIEDNNEILRGMRSDARWSKFFRLAYWVAVVLIGLFVWSYLGPVVDGIAETIDRISGVSNDISNSLTQIQQKASSITEFFNKVSI